MTTPGIPALLEPIQERLDAATPGPWETYDANEGEWPPRPMWCVANDAFHNPTADEDEPWLAVEIHTGCKEDADFIAASPTDTARLLAAVKAVEEWCLNLDAVEKVNPSSSDNLNASAGAVANILRKSIESALREEA
ncbi:hypothetical protein QN084_06225 [Paenarthrobacter sp. R1]|uniref:hypothetical protein n=1 Tax=Paenarthrobacter sp. R1 TaxID=3049085 RepID=UPI002552C3F0|nr:hypothetical protein [Paenarthrobacter sp. R1]WIV32204.1 hypothetical protein QN084_06225 [Paenarthrobacter sp. R1]